MLRFGILSINLAALTIGFTVFNGAFALPSNAQQASPDETYVLERLNTVTWGRYMEGLGCSPEPRAGWDSKLPTKLCRYRSDSGAVVKVVMLNPENDMLAKWIVTACSDAGASDLHVCSERLALNIKCQSGNQFPIAGLVQESALMVFRDGVTVGVSELFVDPRDGPLTYTNRKPTPKEIDLAIGYNEVTKVKFKARIQSTTREDFSNFAHVPLADLAGIKWREVVAREYQLAWTSPQNRLLSAWATAHKHSLEPTYSWDDFFTPIAGCRKNTKWTRW